MARGYEVLLGSFICNVLLALCCPPTSPLACEQALPFGRVKRVSREKKPRGAPRSRVLVKLASLAQIRRACSEATSPLNQRFALIEKLVFTLCCGWGGGGGGVGWLVYLVLELIPIIWHQIVWSRDQNFDMVATQNFLRMLSNPPWCHQSIQWQCYHHSQNKTQAHVGTIRGILLVAYFSIVPLFDSWLCYIRNIYLTSP